MHDRGPTVPPPRYRLRDGLPFGGGRLAARPLSGRCLPTPLAAGWVRGRPAAVEWETVTWSTARLGRGSPPTVHFERGMSVMFVNLFV